MADQIDLLRDLLNLPNRYCVSVVALGGVVETTRRQDNQRTFIDSGDRAYVFIGPKGKLVGERHEGKDGTVTFTFTMPT